MKEFSVDPQKPKVKAIWECPTTKNVTKVCSFLDLAKYYRRFVKGLS